LKSLLPRSGGQEGEREGDGEERQGAVGSSDYNGDNLGGNTECGRITETGLLYGEAGRRELFRSDARHVSSSGMFRWRLRSHRRDEDDAPRMIDFGEEPKAQARPDVLRLTSGCKMDKGIPRNMLSCCYIGLA
jgi:hypothetical protein